MSVLSDRRARLQQAVYSDHGFGEDATWIPVSGDAPYSVRVRLDSGEAIANFGESPAIVPILIVRVRRSEIANPAEGDRLTLPLDGGGLDAITLIAEPRLEPRGIEWLCEAVRS